MKTTEYFKLFSHNIPVKGIEKSAIYNLQKANVLFIPNSFYDLLMKFKIEPVATLKENHEKKDQQIFHEYLEFLTKNELGFYTENIGEYPDLNLQWKSPNTIMNSVIQFDFNQSPYELSALLQELDELMCFHLELRIEGANIKNMEEVSALLERKVFRSICLILDFHPSFISNLDAIFDANPKIESIIVYNAEKNTVSEKKPDRIHYFKKDILKELQNRSFPLDHYVLNVKYFTEALQYHTYYNKKVCIGKLGEIKNCLRHKTKFGSFPKNKIITVLEETNFKNLWYAAPDKVIDYQDDALRYCKFYTDQLEEVSDGFYKVVY